MLSSALALLRLLELRELLRCRGGLIARLPFVIRHAVDALLGRAEIDIDALLLRRLDVPLAEAISAKAREDHQVDVLHVLSLVEMLQQASKHGRVELELGPFIHNSHVLLPSA